MAQLQPYMPFIVMAINGLIAGWLVGLLFGGKGLIGNLIIGLIGALVGGALVHFGLLRLPFDFNTIVPVFGNQIAVSTIGAAIVVLVSRFIAK